MAIQMQQMIEYRKQKAELFSNRETSEDQLKKIMKELEGNEQVPIPAVSNRRAPNSTVPAWPFPRTNEEQHRYTVFEDLWQKGYYLTNGSKFGGDFLAYSGDPLQYHAHYVIIVKFSEEELTPLDVISYGRLGVTVKKTPVLASVFYKDAKPTVLYFSVDWQGVT